MFIYYWSWLMTRSPVLVSVRYYHFKGGIFPGSLHLFLRVILNRVYFCINLCSFLLWCSIPVCSLWDYFYIIPSQYTKVEPHAFLYLSISLSEECSITFFSPFLECQQSGSVFVYIERILSLCAPSVLEVLWVLNKHCFLQDFLSDALRFCFFSCFYTWSWSSSIYLAAWTLPAG